MRITLGGRWATGPSFYAGWMRRRGSVCLCFVVTVVQSGCVVGYGADGCVTVFRAAHDSAKAMRVWMGEMKKM